MLIGSPNPSNASPPSPNKAPQGRWLTQAEFRRHLSRATVPPLLLLAAHTAIITLLFIYFLRAAGWSQHGEQVRTTINDVERVLATLESSARGYLLTHDEAFLTPAVRARPRLEPLFDSLATLLSDNPLQFGRLQKLRVLVEGWDQLAREWVAHPASVPIAPELRLQLENRRVRMDEIREALREMVLTETQLLDARHDYEQQATTTLLFGGIAVSLLLAGGLALVTRRTAISLSAMYQNVMDEEATAAGQFFDLAQTIPQLIWISDAAGQPTFFNRPWSEFTAKSPDDLKTLGWIESLHPEDAPTVISQWTHSIQSGAPFEGEYRLKRGGDGGYRWFLCRAIPVTNAAGQRTRWFGSCTDIENQKQVARERETALAAERAARSDLLRNSRAKDEFLATLSHELRTPMTAILGWARLLRDPKIRDSELNRAIEAIDNNARAQARLIEDLLDMGRINSGKLVLKIEAVDLTRVIRAAVDAVRPAAENKRLQLSLDLPEQPVSISGDASRMQQVIWNLLTNAVKFTPSFGSVSVSLKQDKSAATIKVTDTGQGINPQFLPYVFQRFRQADGSTTRQHGGLGLGLAIVEHLVQMHGGTVTAESGGEGAGATFSIELPLTESSPHHPPARQESPAALIGHKRILVVDDDRDTATVVRLILENAGCEVAVADGATEALELLRGGRFDLMISDIGMPNIDGYGLIKRVREMEAPGQKPMPAIALTAFARPNDRAAALEAGFVEHVTKPVMPADLVRIVAQVLRCD